MKKVVRSLMVILFFTAIQTSELQADHFMGGELTYETIDLDTLRGIFRIKLRLERPCNSFNQFIPEYAIKVLEFDSKRSPNYNLSVYAAKLYDSSYIYYPCTAPTASCSNSGGQVIEVKYYQAQIVVQNSNKECIVFFDEYSNRSYSDNLLNPDDPMVLLTSFIPRYINTQFSMSEAKRHFPIKGQLSTVIYNLSDPENDSLFFSTSIPYKGIFYSTTGSNVSYTFVKSQTKIGLNDQKPFFMQEGALINSQTTVSFTPSVEQNSWLTILKSEYRKIRMGIKDTWICINKSNSDRLFAMFNINSQFRLRAITSSSPLTTISGNQITICNNGSTNAMQFHFPIESGIQATKYRIMLGQTDISSQFTANRVTGTGGIDTLHLNFNYLHPNYADLTTQLRFDFELCHTNSGIGFDRSFTTPLTIFNYKIFSQDTILSCSSSLTIPTLVGKSLSLNWGNFSPSSKTVFIVNPKDTWIIAQLAVTHALCPTKDSVFVNQGSIFTTNTRSYMPSCKGYADAAAKVIATGANGPFTFRWSNSSTLDSISSIRAGVHYVEVRDKDNCVQIDSVVISEPQGIDAEWIIDIPITCYGGNNGRGHIQVNSSLLPSQYNWTSVIAVDSFLDQLSAGEYKGSYRYTNAANLVCDQPFSFYITQPDSIYLHIAKTDNTCFGESKGKIAVLPIGGYGDFTFYFNNEESNVGYKGNLSNGNVDIYVKDKENCVSSVRTIAIQSPNKLSYVVNATNPSCAEVSNGQILLNHLNGGVSPYQFSFNNTDYSFITNFTDLGIGTYNLKMRDANNCIFSQNFTLNPSYVLQVKPDLIEASKCPLSNSGKIHLTINNGLSPYNIYFQKDSQISTIQKLEYNNLSKGNYLVKIRDQNQCSWLSQFQINEPDTIVLNSNIKHESCFNFHDGRIEANITGGGTPPYTSMRWYNSQNALLPNALSLSPDNYFLRFEDSKNCTYEYRFNIAGKSKLITDINIADLIACHGSSTGRLKANTSGGKPPYTYHWQGYPNNTTNELSQLAAGSYYLETIDADLCSDKDSALLSQPNPIVLESIKIKNVDCPAGTNGAMTISALNGNGTNATLVYKIKGKTDFSLSKTILDLSKGEYSIIVRDSIGCEKEFNTEVKTDKSIEVQMPGSQILEIGTEFQMLPNLLFGDNTNSTDIKLYKWNPADRLSCSDCLTPSFVAVKSEIYALEVEYGKGCKANASTSFEVSRPEEVYIPNSFSPNGDNKNDIWYIYGKYVVDFDAKIFNRAGELIYASQDILKGWDGTFKGSKEPVNTYKYIVKVTYTDKNHKIYEGSLNLFR